MLTKIDNGTKRGNGPIRVMYPGLALGAPDTGLATIGRIDQAAIPAGALIAMHPHVNDEILTYLRRGRVRHADSTGFEEDITPQRLMLMKAGRRFFHEEQVMEDGGLLEGLQIFIRPEEKDLEPQVTFYELPEVHSKNAWRLIAGRGDSGAPLTLRSSTWIYDARLTAGSSLELPGLPKENLTRLLYLFEGTASVGEVWLTGGDSVVIDDESRSEVRSEGADLVLFVTDAQSRHYDGGMFSGNQF